ncbi:MAG: hypothetical protein KAT46_07105 [Deltaproteobacteria bacterium]|nr:hypothetical protein [Deltaproteobacteria bacterium]
MYIIDKFNIKSEKGEITFKLLLFLLVATSIGYAAYIIAPPYISYNLMKKEIATEVRNSYMYDDAEIRTKIMTKADEWWIPLMDHHVKINRYREEIEIMVSWDVTLNFLNFYEWTVYFDIHEIGDVKKTSSGKYN